MKTRNLLIAIVLFIGQYSMSGQSNCQGKTYTQGGWGTGCNGGNPGCYRDANFASAFPSGLTIGCGTNIQTFATSASIQSALPTGGTAGVLPNGGVLVGQLVALKLNIGFDANDPNFSPSNLSIGNYHIASGVFQGLTVSQFVAIADNIIGGCSTAYSFSDVNSTATSINENYDNGSSDQGFLNCCMMTATANASAILCNGGTSNVNITVTGGASPLTGSGPFTVSAGSYSYTISDANSCTASVSVIISQPASLEASSSSGSIACFGGSAGVSVSANGGTAPYSGIGTFTRNAGPYLYAVYDANGCTANTSGNITEPSQLFVSSIPGTIACFGGTTSVEVSASGGTTPYTGNGTFSRNSGPYLYTVTDANGCIANTSGAISQPALLETSSSPGSIACFGGTTSVEVSASGGTAPYTGTGAYSRYTGPYLYSVTDANGCIANTTGSIPEPTLLGASSEHGNIACFGGTTSVEVSASGGTLPYTGTGIYSRNSGPYLYVVTDANGCTANTSESISQPTLLEASSEHGNIACFGGTTSVEVSASGGSLPYTGTGIYSRNSGPYLYVVTDANGCTANTSESISQPSLLEASSEHGNIACFGGTTSVAVSALGGTGLYTGTGTYARNNGPYIYMVTDANGCTAIASGNIAQPDLMVASSVSGTILCNGGTANVNVTASGGTTPYSGTGIFNVSSGSFTYNVTDNNGCSSVTEINVPQPAPLSLVTATANVTCYGGSANVTANVSGGTMPYSYAWNSTPAQNTSVASLPVGAYTVAVVDAHGCTISGNVNIVLMICSGYKTATMGGWGAGCSGGNIACYRNSNFASAFPSGITLGAGSKQVRITSSTGVQNFLPSGGTPGALATGTLTNPSKQQCSNTLAGQCLAAKLAVGFDQYDVNYSSATSALSGLIVNSGTFEGWSVAEIIAEADKVLGGQSSPYTASQLTTMLNNINSNYDNGTSNLGYLACACQVYNRMSANNSQENNGISGKKLAAEFSNFPNPFSSSTTVRFRMTESANVAVDVYNISGQKVASLFEGLARVNESNNVVFNAENLAEGMYMIVLTSDSGTETHKVLVSK